MNRCMLTFGNYGNEIVKALTEGRKYYDMWMFGKAKECLNEAEKYRRKLNIPITEISFLKSQIDQCAYLEYLLDSAYDAVDADKIRDAQEIIRSCLSSHRKFLNYVYAMDEEHALKFEIKINNADDYIDAKLYNYQATIYLVNAQELAKAHKFDKALEELNEAEKCASFMETMNLISTERLKIQQDRDRENEAAENKRLDNAARSVLNTINYKNNSASFQLTTSNYEKAASLARNKTLVEEIKREKAKFLDYAVPYCINEAKGLLKENKFEGANSKFDEASCMARDVLCPKKHLDDLEKEVRSAYNARAQYLQKIANDFVKDKKLNEAEEKFQEALCFAKDDSIINLIKADKDKIDKDMKDVQLDNKRAMVLLELGQVHVMKNEFQLAEEKLQLALKSVKDEALKEKIETEAASANAKRVKYLQKEGNDLLGQNKFKESIDKFKEAVKIVKDNSLKKTVKADKSKAVNQYTKLLLKQANELANQNKFKEAYDYIEEALNLNEDTSTALGCKAETKNKEGMFYLKESFKLESSEPCTEKKCKEAKEKLNRAYEVLKEAEEFSKTKEEKNIKIVESKINGNKCFNEALLIEGKAFDIYEDAKKYKKLAHYTSVQEKYQKAKELYEKAKGHFTDGFKLGYEEFQTSINLASDQVSNIPKVITNIDMLKLKCKFDNKREIKNAL